MILRWRLKVLKPPHLITHLNDDIIAATPGERGTTAVVVSVGGEGGSKGWGGGWGGLTHGPGERERGPS